MTDNEWIELLKSSQKEAQEYLFSTYRNLVYVIVINKLGSSCSREDIDDCVNDVFMEIFANALKFTPETGNLKTFVGTIAKRRAIDAFRQLSRKYSSSDSLDKEEDAYVPVSEENIEADSDKKEQKSELWKAVKELGEPDSTIITYQYFYGMTVVKIAEKLNMKRDAVQKRSTRARDKLKKILSSTR